jgi:hypothetical protein
MNEIAKNALHGRFGMTLVNELEKLDTLEFVGRLTDGH